jgi:HAD superfamily phosphoserine phosphatase-like hydrolase
MLRTDTEVYLTGPDFLDVYSSKSSILNRFVVSQLARMGRWQWLNGPIDVPPTRDLVSGQYRVRFTPSGDAPYEELFKVVVLRHGPKPALEHDFPAIWQACQKLAAEWREMPPHLDPTREPLKWQPLFDRPPRARFQPAPPPLPDEFKLVAFDIDGTLLRGKDFIWSWSLVWSFLGYEDEERRNLMRNYRGTLIEGREGWHEAYQSWCDEAADRFKEKGLKRSDFTEIAKAVAPVSGLGETIHALKAAGIHLAIISGGIDQLIEATLSKYLPDFHDIYVNKFLFDEQGLFTGVEATRYDFKGKVDAVLEICDKYDLSPDQAVFVGDGFNDVHLLDNVGRTICFIGTDEEMENESDVRLVFPNGDPDLRAILPHILPAGRAPRNG